jgi:hypothetical protein
MLRRIRQFLGHVIPRVIRPLRVLWNEIIGFVFLALAVWAIPSTVRSVREFKGDADSLFRVILAGLPPSPQDFTLLSGSPMAGETSKKDALSSIRVSSL